MLCGEMFEDLYQITEQYYYWVHFLTLWWLKVKILNVSNMQFERLTEN